MTQRGYQGPANSGVNEEGVLRAFIALEATPSVLDCARAGLESARSTPGAPERGWSDPETMHITLKFLGDIPGARVPDVAAAIADVASALSAPQPKTLDFGAFPNMRRARVLVMELSGDEVGFRALSSALDDRLATLGIAKETRPYRPHVTLARLRTPGDVRTLGKQLFPVELCSPCFTGIALYRSTLSKQGAIHTVLAKSPFTQIQ